MQVRVDGLTVTRATAGQFCDLGILLFWVHKRWLRMCRDHATIWEQLPHPAMKQTGEIRLRIPQELIARLDHEKPKVLSLTSFCALLIEQGIDKFDRGAKVLVSPAAGPPQGNLRPLTGNKPSLKQPEGESEALQEQQLPPQPTEAVQSSAQELDHEKKHIVVKSEIKVEKARKSRAKKTKGTPEFEAFWKRYQGCRHRANGQSKPKAMELWGQLVPDELQPDDLMRAIDGAIEDIRSRQGVGEFASPLPDCFRWLRDECYAVYLEDNAPAPTKSAMFL
jgi:hypothetical protein